MTQNESTDEIRKTIDKAIAMNLPGLMTDAMIEHACLFGNSPMIEPFEYGVKRPGVISYGLTSAGYDVRLGRKFKVVTDIFGGRMIDPKNIDPKCFHEIEDDFCVIPPNSYVLGESVEFFRIPRNVAVICIGKSTYARCGIIVNVTPGEPEWEGRWTIEISNSSPVPAKVYANEGIMQCMFFRTAIPCHKSYKDKGGKYQGDQGMQHAKVD